ncbi:MAG: CDC27 family protein [bacterium]
MSKQFLFSWPTLICFLLLVLYSLLCTQLPLFNYLGYEFSALTALVAGLLTGFLTISFWIRWEKKKEPNLWQFTRSAFAVEALLFLVPAVVLSLNAFVVKNCSWEKGILFYLFTPLPAVLLAHALALFISVQMHQWRRVTFVFVYLLMLLHLIIVPMAATQIFVFNPIIGFFPGVTYDETMKVLDRLFLYRIGTVAAACFLITIAQTLYRRALAGKEAGSASRITLVWWEQYSLGLFLLIILVLYFSSNSLGLSSSSSFIRDEFHGVKETEHFIIIYPDTMLKGVDLDMAVQLHEFHYRELSEQLQIAPAEKITSYLYASEEEKARLIGAGGTNITKPWLREMHMNLADVRGVLRHEMVHVLAAEFGIPLLRISLNSGFIEGLAVALDPVEYSEHIHRLAAMVFAVRLQPDMASLFSITGFMKQSPTISYTMAGSFCRFLIDRYGINRFKIAYRTGNLSLAYGKPFITLQREWRRLLRRSYVSEGERKKAVYLFRRPSIFAKECARTIANLNAEAQSLFGSREYQRALETSNRSLELSRSTSALSLRINALFRLERYQEAIDYSHAVLGDSSVAHSLITLKLVLGDSYWAIDSIAAAKQQWEELLSVQISPAWDEACALRLEALMNLKLARELKPYFLQDLDTLARRQLLEKLSADVLTNSVPNYLLARDLSFENEIEKSIQCFFKIPRMKIDVLEGQRMQRTARLNLRLGRYERSKIYYWRSLNYITNQGRIFETEERIRFGTWMYDHRTVE